MATRRAELRSTKNNQRPHTPLSRSYPHSPTNLYAIVLPPASWRGVLEKWVQWLCQYAQTSTERHARSAERRFREEYNTQKENHTQQTQCSHLFVEFVEIGALSFFARETRSNINSNTSFFISFSSSSCCCSNLILILFLFFYLYLFFLHFFGLIFVAKNARRCTEK